MRTVHIPVRNSMKALSLGNSFCLGLERIGSEVRGRKQGEPAGDGFKRGV